MAPPSEFLWQEDESDTNDESDEAEEEHMNGCQPNTKNDDTKDSEPSRLGESRG
jgi:hypothetical protein